MSESQTKICQNCKEQFVIGAQDFQFYEKIKVPPPTFCPQCRFIRRMAWRNERALYKRACDLCRKSIISMYPADAVFPVYCRECWYSDKWDAVSYGRDYDFSKPFFVQFRDLLSVVPQMALWQRNVVNSDFSNMCGECKNVYLSSSVVVGSENVFYSKSVDGSCNIFDSHNVVGSDSCYWNIQGEKNYNCHYIILSRNCMDSRFLVDCVNCRNCLLSSNLRNKEFYIRNKPYSKEDYFRKLAEMNIGERVSREEFIALRKRILEHMNVAPYKDAGGREYRYGEFFPIELSPFAYNESLAQDFSELKKDEALHHGYRWRDPEKKSYAVTVLAQDIPSDIAMVQDEILEQTLGCVDDGICSHQCSIAFRLVPDELQFYRRNSIPIPNKCANCRYYERNRQLLPPRLWHRRCMCDYKIYKNSVKHAHHPEGQCTNEFETSYAPERPEIVYCEQCYNAEVA